MQFLFNRKSRIKNPSQAVHLAFDGFVADEQVSSASILGNFAADDKPQAVGAFGKDRQADARR